MQGDSDASRLTKQPRILASLNEPGFRLFSLHSSLAAVDMSVRVAVHGWLILELSNDSEIWVGIFALTLGIGQFISSMLAGAIVDRFQRRNLLLLEGTASALIAWGLTIAIFLDIAMLWMAIALAFIMGCLRAMRFTAANRFIYDLVGPQQLVNGASLWRISGTPMMILGALVAGALIEWVGLWASYGFIAINLVVGLPFLVLIGVKGTVERSSASLIQQTVDGAKYAAKDQPLRTLFTISMAMEGLGFAFLAMIPVMAKVVLEVGGIGLGFLQAGVGAGMLIANLVMAAKGDSKNKPRVIFFNALIAGVALIGFSLSQSLLLSVFLAMATMAFLNAYDLTLGALMQLVAPPNLRGRAVSLHSLAISFVWIGGFVMGTAGSVVGVPTMLAAGGAGIVVNSLLRRRALMLIQEPRHTNIAKTLKAERHRGGVR